MGSTGARAGEEGNAVATENSHGGGRRSGKQRIEPVLSRALRLVAVAAAFICAALALVPSAWSADGVTLTLTPSVAPYGTPVQLTGSVTPPAAGETVQIAVQAGDTWQPVGTAVTAADGTFGLELPSPAPGTYQASVGAVASAPVSLTVKPKLTASLRGQRIIGATLRLTGRLEPVEAGTLTVSVNGRRQTVAPNANGSFQLLVPASRIGRLPVVVRLDPAAGFAAVSQKVGTRVAGPALRLGSHGAAVEFLERRLAQLRYALIRVDGRFGVDTADAVLAFRKVRGLARVSSVDRAMWRALMTAQPPRPRVRGGDHVEVDKTRQILFEVRGGRVVRAVHVSTGATGNTPVGTWRVYWKDAGYNSLGMYYSLYFLRGFAMHGYNPVPAYPASHGCVRVPIWYAVGLFNRWSVGATVRIFA
jgi:hypothetical protein